MWWRPVCCATWSSGPPGRDSFPLASGNQGMKPIRCPLAVVEDIVGAALGDVVLVLHAHDGHDRPTPPRSGTTLTSDNPTSDTFPSSRSDFEESVLLFGRHVGVDPVQLEQVDALDSEAEQAAFALPAQVLRATAWGPRAGTGPGEAGLGGDLQVARVRVERLTDELLGHIRAVGIGRVDQVDAQLDGATQDGNGAIVVTRRSPDAGTRKLHRPEAEAVHVEHAQPQGAGFFDHRPSSFCLAGAAGAKL